MPEVVSGHGDHKHSRKVMCSPHIDSYRPPEWRIDPRHCSGNSAAQQPGERNSPAAFTGRALLDVTPALTLAVWRRAVGARCPGNRSFRSWLRTAAQTQRRDSGARDIHSRLYQIAFFVTSCYLKSHSPFINSLIVSHHQTHRAHTTWRCRFSSKIGLLTTLRQLISVWKLSLSFLSLSFLLDAHASSRKVTRGSKRNLQSYWKHSNCQHCVCVYFILLMCFIKTSYKQIGFTRKMFS